MPSREFQRTDRVNAELRRELGTLVHTAVRDGQLPQVSVEDVIVTRDLRSATVWITTLQREDAAAATAALRALSGRLRHALSQHMRTRRVPELRFRYDESVERAEHIDALLRGAGHDDPA